MTHITFDYSKSLPFIQEYEMSDLQSTVRFFDRKIRKSQGVEQNSLGWLNYPVSFDVNEFNRIKTAALKVRGNSEVLLVIGVGGSYMGSRAGIEMLTHTFQNELSTKQRVGPQVIFAGNNLSSSYISDVIDLLEGKDFSINVISKSGTTLEPAIAFRVFRKLLVDKYGRTEAQSRIYITTDREKGTLNRIAKSEGYETFNIPRNIGGRFSALTSVGLFPMAVSGICIDSIMEGASTARTDLTSDDLNENVAYQYAAIRNLLYSKGKGIELLVSYEPNLQSFSEWWKQLYAESEGKDGRGIFPTSAVFSTDLHSLGQYIQDGRKNIFETIIKVGKPNKDVVIENEETDFDELNYLNGKTVNYLNLKALDGTLQAHTNGGVPNLIIQIPEMNAYTFGYLVYFFQLACVMSGYILGVNPFNQPGVEAYKSNMYQLLGKREYQKSETI
ncbi:glucose-6-phosphate isomerase [Sporosarcina siberiensis]|uniref:Glucose-6-phosphate isomerase n=1 Tax=Sporosarcina siberiensis TaxID=1365606 RepID=A0ABW4SG27_9BACL